MPPAGRAECRRPKAVRAGAVRAGDRELAEARAVVHGRPREVLPLMAAAAAANCRHSARGWRTARNARSHRPRYGARSARRARRGS
ncbi:hypothetical protein [Streptomyces thioluteus]|uniref:hypothetical protein n=1 Tax=Streptomyces thioluteus TaxID=66431 RepID=UPI0031EE59FB